MWWLVSGLLHSDTISPTSRHMLICDVLPALIFFLTVTPPNTLQQERRKDMTLLYHGSNVAIEQIDLSRSKRGKDFGQGFYLNANPEQAMAMAI